MATENETIDQVGNDVSDSTERTVDEIGNNLSDTASELGGGLKKSLIDMLSGSMEPPRPENIPIPDIAPSPLSENGHQAIKDATAEQSNEAPGMATTLHDQLKQAEEQFAQIG